MRRFTIAVIAALIIVPAAPAAAQVHVDIKEWPVPWENSRPRDPYVGPGGQVWFVGQTGHYVAYLDPETGDFQRFDLDDGAGPHNLIVDDEGIVWYAGNRQSHIGRLDPADGTIQKIMMPDPAARDPHTLVFDQAGDIWFTVQGGNMMGKLDVGTREVKLVASETERARPYGIIIDGDGRPWINLFGSNRIATIDPQTFALREIALDRADARTRRIAMTSDGRVWYVDYARGYLGAMDPETGAVVGEWVMPGGESSRPYAMAVDASDRIWFVETGANPNRFVGFDPASEEFFSNTAIPSGGGAVRHMVYHAPTNSIWFGTDAGTIGRATLP